MSTCSADARRALWVSDRIRLEAFRRQPCRSYLYTDLACADVNTRRIYHVTGTSSPNRDAASKGLACPVADQNCANALPCQATVLAQLEFSSQAYPPNLRSSPMQHYRHPLRYTPPGPSSRYLRKSPPSSRMVCGLDVFWGNPSAARRLASTISLERQPRGGATTRESCPS